MRKDYMPAADTASLDETDTVDRHTKGELARELNIGGFEVDRIVPIHKRMGVMRGLHREFGLSYDWFITRGLSAALAPVVPGSIIAHMIMAVACKPKSER